MIYISDNILFIQTAFVIIKGLKVPEDQDEWENNVVAEVTPSPKTDSKFGNEMKDFRSPEIWWLSLLI